MNVHPALCGGNGKATGLNVVLSEESGILSVFLGTALLERLRCSPEALQYRMLVGRLVNAGWRPSELQGVFGHDPRTMKRWAAALLSDDLEFVAPCACHKKPVPSAFLAPLVALAPKKSELSGGFPHPRPHISP